MADSDAGGLESNSLLIDIDMPKLSDAMEEATVIAWLKRPGDVVAPGEPLVEVETDKATVVYEAETGGVLAEILVEEGSVADLGAAIARLRVGSSVAQHHVGRERSRAPTSRTRDRRAGICAIRGPRGAVPGRWRYGVDRR